MSKTTAPHRQWTQPLVNSPGADHSPNSPTSQCAYTPRSTAQVALDTPAAPRAISPFEFSQPHGVGARGGGARDGGNSNGQGQSFRDGSRGNESGTLELDLKRNFETSRGEPHERARHTGGMTGRRGEGREAYREEEEKTGADMWGKATKASRLRLAKNVEKLEGAGKGSKGGQDKRLHQLAEQIALELYRSKRNPGDQKKSAFR